MASINRIILCKNDYNATKRLMERKQNVESVEMFSCGRKMVEVKKRFVFDFLCGC